jgi:TolB-like protein/class 3 adenylate cyclase
MGSMDKGHRHLAAILFTDIVGYTAMMQQNEQQALVTVKRHRHVLEKCVAAHFGEVLDYYGDGSLSVFPSATDAVTCAVEVQKEFQKAPVVPLRIGLHIGEIFFEDGNPYGNGVNVSSRIQSLGKANTVLLSKEIVDKIKNHPQFTTVSLGMFEFKNVEEPMEVFALSNEGLVVPKREELTGKLKEGFSHNKTWRFKKRVLAALSGLLLLTTSFLIYHRFIEKPAMPSKENSIAVLYFNNMSGDPEQEYFSDGMTEEIIARLSMISGLRVKSRTSVVQYKDQRKSATQIAREMGVRNILEGSVRKQGDKVRITAQLINAETDEHIWSENYDRELKDVFKVQSDIAHQIAAKFKIRLTDVAEKNLRTPSTQNTEAYDKYLKALNLSSLDWGLGGKQPNRLKAIILLKEAIQLDPNFPEAYALLSNSYAFYSQDADNPKQLIDSSETAARKALDLAPDRDLGYKALAFVYETRGDLDEALKWLLQVHEIIPYSTAGWMSSIYRRKKEFGKGFEWVMNAIDYDPAEAKHYLSKAGIFYDVGLLDSMKYYIDIAKRMNPESLETDYSAFQYYLRKGDLEGYRRVNRFRLANDDKEFAYNMGIFYFFQRDWKMADSLYSISSHPDDLDAGLVKIRLGKREEGVRYLKNVIERRLRFKDFDAVWHNFDISRAYAALEDPRYIEYWNKAVEKGWHDYLFLQQDPFFDFVRNTPEFKRLKQQVYERNEQFKADLFASMKKYYREN